MSFNITLPVGMEHMDWADQITFDLDNQTSLSKLMNENEWQDWAVQFVTATGLSGYNVPTPYAFDDWQPWADSLCKALEA
jgi:hypothetical protein